MLAVVLTKIWLSIPLFMAFFLAGLQNLDREQIDAARVDGAGNWAVLRDHILPHLRPVLIIVVVLGRDRQSAAVRHDLRADRRRPGACDNGPVRRGLSPCLRAMGYRLCVRDRRAVGCKPYCLPHFSICACS
jgi:hypothetical protein